MDLRKSLSHQLLEVSDSSTLHEHVPMASNVLGGSQVRLGHIRDAMGRVSLSAASARPVQRDVLSLDEERDEGGMTLGALVTHDAALSGLDVVISLVAQGSETGSSH